MSKFKPSLHCSGLILRLHTWTGEAAMMSILSTSLMGLGRTKVESGSLCYCIGASSHSGLLFVTHGVSLNQAGSLRYSGTSRTRNTKGEHIRTFLVCHVAVAEVGNVYLYECVFTGRESVCNLLVVITNITSPTFTIRVLLPSSRSMGPRSFPSLGPLTLIIRTKGSTRCGVCNRSNATSHSAEN